MKTEHQQRIEKMMDKMGQDVPAHPTIPDEGTRLLRAKLIMEEALETVRALGFSPHVTTGIIDEDALFFRSDGDADLVAIADGCADISVVTIGTLSACGISDNPILTEVDKNNLTKFGPGSYRREDGKWMKPPDFVGPDLVKVLKEQSGDSAC